MNRQLPTPPPLMDMPAPVPVKLPALSSLIDSVPVYVPHPARPMPVFNPHAPMAIPAAYAQQAPAYSQQGLSYAQNPSLISPAVTPVEQNQFAFISHTSLTFKTHEPKIDNMQLARRKRRRTSSTELSVLEHEFRRCLKPTRAVREAIAAQTGMTEKAVQIWFQNRRQAHKRKAEVIGQEADQETCQEKSQESEENGQEKTQDRTSLGNIYEDDEAPRSGPTMRKNAFKLSMSEDGKAVVVKRDALSPVKASQLNRVSPTKHKAQTRVDIASLVNDRRPLEQECISNLLSLRSGAWN